jgi:hypothetical protein
MEIAKTARTGAIRTAKTGRTGLMTICTITAAGITVVGMATGIPARAGGYMWDNYPGWTAFGLTMWGVNRLSYGFGYEDYSNPYYGGSSGGYDYSEPLMTYSDPAATRRRSHSLRSRRPSAGHHDRRPRRLR